MTDKKATSFRLSLIAEGLLAWQAEQLGISKTAVLELAIRAYAYRADPPTPAVAGAMAALATGDGDLAARVDELFAALDQG